MNMKPPTMGEKKDHDGDGDIDSKDYMMAKDKAIKKAMGEEKTSGEMDMEMYSEVSVPEGWSVSENVYNEQ